MVAGADALLIGVIQSQGRRSASAFTTEREFHIGGFAAVDVTAAVDACRHTTRLAGDDVDDTGDGVGPVDRRRAVAQHFDAFDDAFGDAVEVCSAGYAAPG